MLKLIQRQTPPRIKLTEYYIYHLRAARSLNYRLYVLSYTYLRHAIFFHRI